MQTSRICVWLVAGLVLLNGCNNATSEQTLAKATDAEAQTEENRDTGSIVAERETVIDQPKGDISEEPMIPTSLAVGDAAPPISVTQWIIGDEVAGLEPGKVHVVEFWATWCSPCRASMPHLSALQQQYGSDVKFIGITDEDEETVRGFLEESSEHDSSETWGQVVGYTLALDETRTMHRSYMAATQQSGIPAAYIVGREGHLLWHGHPMGMDEPLAQIVASEWTRENASEKMAELEEAEAAMRAVLSRFSDAQRAGDWDEALVTLDELFATAPDFAAAMGNRLVAIRYELLSKANREHEAAELAGPLSEALWEDAGSLNALSWNIAAEFPETAARDLDLALKLATRASELTDNSDAAILDTVARVHFERGELDQAIEWQEKAVTHADGNSDFAETLEKYQTKRE